MEIVIYRRKIFSMINIFKYVLSMLKQEFGIIEYKDNCTIKVENVVIEFFCGDYNRMGGIRPDVFNTNCRSASMFLQQGASKVNGIEIYSIEKLLEKIKMEANNYVKKKIW